MNTMYRFDAHFGNLLYLIYVTVDFQFKHRFFANKIINLDSECYEK